MLWHWRLPRQHAVALGRLPARTRPVIGKSNARFPEGAFAFTRAHLVAQLLPQALLTEQGSKLLEHHHKGQGIAFSCASCTACTPHAHTIADLDHVRDSQRGCRARKSPQQRRHGHVCAQQVALERLHALRARLLDGQTVEEALEPELLHLVRARAAASSQVQQRQQRLRWARLGGGMTAGQEQPNH